MNDIESKSKTQLEILNHIINYISEHGYPPTIRELCDMTGLKSTSTVQSHINKMFKNGMLETDCGIGASRAIKVPGYKFVKESDCDDNT